MQFNDTTNKNGLIQDIDFWLFSGSETLNTTYSLADRTRRINERINKALIIIFRNDRRWKYDDFNQSDMNIFYTDIVGSQQDYEVSGADFLTIDEVAIKKDDGKYSVLTPIVREGGSAQDLQNLEDGDDGMPLYYEKYGNSIMLYPKPKLSVLTASDGLMIRGKRVPSYFLSTDTTKQAGVNPLFHDYLSQGAAMDGALSLGMTTKAKQLQEQVLTLEQELAEHYSLRSEDEQPGFTLANTDEYHDNLYQ
jgi:hypothetical protein